MNRIIVASPILAALFIGKRFSLHIFVEVLFFWHDLQKIQLITTENNSILDEKKQKKNAEIFIRHVVRPQLDIHLLQYTLKSKVFFHSFVIAYTNKLAHITTTNDETNDYRVYSFVHSYIQWLRSHQQLHTILVVVVCCCDSVCVVFISIFFVAFCFSFLHSDAMWFFVVCRLPM